MVRAAPAQLPSPKSPLRIHTLWLAATCGLLLVSCKDQVTALPETVTVDERSRETSHGATEPVADQRPKDDSTPFAELLLTPRDREILEAPSATGTTSGDTQESSEPQQSVTVTRLTPNPAKLAEHGIRVLVGKHVTVYTDLPESVAVNELPAVFDKAVPQWAQYLRVPNVRVEGWHVSACVMESAERFRTAELLPPDVPEFPYGYQQGEVFWVFQQPSDYYLRHIFLHEGTHAFMNNLMGGAGPPWYMEGIAELLATHKWQDNQLTLNYMPKSRDEVPYWGRIKIIRDEFAAGRALMLQDVMQLEHAAFRDVTAYAWAWAAAAFLDGHPAYQDRFRALRYNVRDTTVRFTRSFENDLLHQLRQVDEEWQLFVLHAEYGYDFARAAVTYKSGVPLPPDGADVTIAADRGWQSTGYRLEAGHSYRIQATGQYVLGQEPRPWSSEPDGVTLHYYQGQPVGRLMGNVRLDVARPGIANLGRPVALGRQRVVKPGDSGTLYLWINESPAQLGDNQGSLRVRLVPLGPAASDHASTPSQAIAPSESAAPNKTDNAPN